MFCNTASEAFCIGNEQIIANELDTMAQASA
jgi:hypothetical protein